MTLSTLLRRRFAVGLAGALLGASLLGSVASVSAADDTNPASDRDRPAEQQATGSTLAPSGFAVQSQSAPVATDDASVLPAQVINQVEPRSDRD